MQGTLDSFFQSRKRKESPSGTAGGADTKRSRSEGQPSEPIPLPSANSHTSPQSETAPFGASEEHFIALKTAVAAMERPTATQMAKLFQEETNADPMTRFSTLWPVKAGAGGSETVPFSVVTDVLADISATGSRLECIKLLSLLLLAVITRAPQDLVAVIYLVINRQAAQHEGVELGIGDAVLLKVVAECCSMKDNVLKEEYKKTGDLAEIAQNRKKNQSTLVRPKPLQAKEVFQSFNRVATTSGKNSMRDKADTIKRLLRDAQGAEINFIIRALQQKMRIGLAEPSALAAVGYALALHFLGLERLQQMTLPDLQLVLNEGAAGIARIFYEVPSLEVIVEAALRFGFLVLIPGTAVHAQHQEALSIRPGLPVKPQLAHPTNGIRAVLDRFQDRKFTCEYKYDGERAQIHYEKSQGFQIFSRNSETHTGKYPDVISMLPSIFDAGKVQSFILDSEVVAVHPETGALQAFQQLQHRGRKNIDEKDVTIPVCVFVFDILYLNGESLLRQDLATRRAALFSHFTPVASKMQFATSMCSDDVEDIQSFLEQSIAAGCEGLMVKTLNQEATYTPAKRSHYWLKLKKDYMDGVTDTLDLVPIGAYYGKGKRTGVFGGFLLACYDPDTEEFQSVCRTGTGFSDEMFEKLTQSFRGLTEPEKPRYYHCSDDKVDVWLKDCQVWEVKAADLSISPAHYAAVGLVDPNRGIALRFPRFIRVRDDKKPTDCTSAQQVAEMYRAQALAVHPNDEGEADEG